MFGFMQGRLSPLVDNKIQAFPVDHWKSEFKEAPNLGFECIEWTLDQYNLDSNPILLQEGQISILELITATNIFVPSCTCDCFMQLPFWKASQTYREVLSKQFTKVSLACHAINCNILVIPLVDNGSLENKSQINSCVDIFMNFYPLLKKINMKVAFECDLPPSILASFISRFPEDFYGINYDTGNSASLGYFPEEEFKYYGHRIFNVHLKDRALNGPTVPFGRGSVDFNLVINLLNDYQYDGNYILQSARSADDTQHKTELQRNFNFITRSSL